jgi:uncharacterized membrane protein (UPF0127 family)
MRYLKFFLTLWLYLFSHNVLSAATGTGFYVSSNGYLVTNYHVIDEAQEITIRDRMGQMRRASIIQVDINNDLALLKVDGDHFSFLTLTNSSVIQKGESVFTIGFPNISLQGIESKVTQGIVSSLSGIRGQPNHMQISVPVQPGNSGGPLLDEGGSVVGIVVAKLAAKAALQTSGALPENVNYAIKSNYLLELLATQPAVNADITQFKKRERKSLPELITQIEPAVVLVIASSSNMARLPELRRPPPAVRPTQPPQGLSQLPVTDLSVNGYNFEVELALDNSSRIRGLMMRQNMPIEQGMFFGFPNIGAHCMWMKNVSFPISMAFLDDQGNILNIEDMKPLTETPHCAQGSARFTLAMNRGWFFEKNIHAGHRIIGIEKIPAPQ